ncbi:MAG: phosphatidate cytidylyltransferase [Clostridiales bacterium]|jgi:phosphatidate cytidylyltransferase|nr:phosphatidate cytidylyltransferase [Clostridiales bacterium]
MNTFTKRLLTGAIILTVIVAAFCLKIWVFSFFMDALILFVSVMALIEVGRAVTPRFAKPLYFIVFAHLFLSYALIVIGRHTEWTWLITRTGSRYSTLLYTSIELPAVFIVMLISAFFFKRVTFPRIVSTAFLLFYPTILLIFLLSLNNIVPINFADAHADAIDFSVFGMVALFAVSLCSDTFAYLVGMTVKGPKLCPNLSPKKTVSGAAGGLLGGVIGAMAAYLLFKYGLPGYAPKMPDGAALPLFHYFIIGILGSVFTQAGDLAASYIKRYCEIKDYSNVFPGHGGFMDRLDGMIFNSVFVYFYLMIIIGI